MQSAQPDQVVQRSIWYLSASETSTQLRLTLKRPSLLPTGVILGRGGHSEQVGAGGEGLRVSVGVLVGVGQGQLAEAVEQEGAEQPALRGLTS